MKFRFQYIALIIAMVLSVETQAVSVKKGTSLISNFPNEEEMDSIRAGGVITWKYPDANGATFTFENVTDGPIATTAGKHYYFTSNGVYAGGAFGVYIPKCYSSDTPIPLIFASHGAYGMGPRELNNWEAVADKYGFIVVTPSYSFATNYNNGGDGTIANIEYEREMTVEIMDSLLTSDLNIDTTRILATGFSGGGMPVHYMMMKFPQYYTAFCLRSANYLTYYTLDIDLDYWRNKPGYIFWSDNDVSFIPGQGEDFLEAFLKTEDNDNYTLASDTHLKNWNSSNGKTKWKENSIGHNAATELVANWFMSLDSTAFSLSDSIALSAQIEMDAAEENLMISLSDEWEADTLETRIYSSNGELLISDTVIYSGTHTIDILALQSGSYTVKLSVGRKEVYREIVTEPATEISDINMLANIYPNPATDRLNLVFSQRPEAGALISLYSLYGQLITRKNAYAMREEIDLGHQAPGIYILTVSGEGLSQSLKLRIR